MLLVCAGRFSHAKAEALAGGTYNLGKNPILDMRNQAHVTSATTFNPLYVYLLNAFLGFNPVVPHGTNMNLANADGSNMVAKLESRTPTYGAPGDTETAAHSVLASPKLLAYINFLMVHALSRNENTVLSKVARSVFADEEQLHTKFTTLPKLVRAIGEFHKKFAPRPTKKGEPHVRYILFLALLCLGMQTEMHHAQ